MSRSVQGRSRPEPKTGADPINPGIPPASLSWAAWLWNWIWYGSGSGPTPTPPPPPPPDEQPSVARCGDMSADDLPSVRVFRSPENIRDC